ncbi:MAG: hypothetical protein ABSH47_12495 [Bryobacteraceae bacterium]
MAALIIAGAPQAHAGVRFGVTVGPAYPPPPCAYAQPYQYPDYYAYPPPAYGYSYGYWRGRRDREYWERGYHEWRGHEWRNHERREHEWRGYRRGRDHWR